MEMESTPRTMLPPPDFNKKTPDVNRIPLHYLTPSGMTLLTRHQQPPPMYGPRGATVPAKYLQKQVIRTQQSPVCQPPADRQFCESCDIELSVGEDLRRHRAEHELCPVESCDYQCHPLVMDRHITSLHSSGLFEKVKKLCTPEEIAAWREDRRKKYPTVENVLMKQRAREQRQKRGERLEANKSRFGKRADCQRLQEARHKDSSKFVSRKQNRKKSRKKYLNQKHKVEQEDSAEKCLKLAVGVKATATSYALDSSDEEKLIGIGKFRGFPIPKLKKERNALTSLIASYGSDSTAETESEIESQSANEQTDKRINDLNHNRTEENVQSLVTDVMAKPKESVASQKSTSANMKSRVMANAQLTAGQEDTAGVDQRTNDSTDEGPDEEPIARTTDLPLRCDSIQTPSISLPMQSKTCAQNPALAKKPPRVFKRKLGLDYRRAKLRRQNTMLEKLLESEIRHERNILLQCVRFVCENDFFGITGSNSCLEKTQS